MTTSCCSLRKTEPKNPACPLTGAKGRPVGPETILALVRKDIQDGLTSREGFLFCPDPACDAVYFSADGKIIRARDVRVPVHQKDPGLDVPVCYCFGHTPRKIFGEIERTGRSTVVASITRKVKNGLCACETSNPQGTCCLRNVSEVVKKGLAKLSPRSKGGNAVMKSGKLGILSSIFASVCCIGPLVAVSLGLGGVSLAAFFGRTHWLWVVAGVVLLAAGWGVYRRESREACEIGCDLAGRRRTRRILTTASVIVVLFLGMNLWTHVVRAHVTPPTVTGSGETLILPVEGMTCFTCEMTLENSLNNLPGVLAVDADSKRKTVTVQMDPAATNKATIIERIRSTGYKVNGGE